MKSLVLVFAALAIGLWAQQPAQPPKDIVISVGTPTVGGPTTVSVFGDVFSGAITGAPYSGDGITETAQAQPDGTRTVTKSTTKIYRDNDGRERREQIVGRGATSITISDPILRVTYTLDPAGKTATKMSSSPPAFIKGGMVGDGFTSTAPSPAEKREDLGQQVIEHISANGTRITSGDMISGELVLARAESSGDVQTQRPARRDRLPADQREPPSSAAISVRGSPPTTA